MDSKFAGLIDRIHESCESLLQQAPITAGHFPGAVPQRGVYLFSEGPRHLYVGRSNDVRGRYSRHCSPGATYRMAGFAFLLAREATGKLRPAYKPGSTSRSGLMDDSEFAAAFGTAKARIRYMDFRWIEENDPVRQCLLEIYCAVALQAAYNDFDNH